MRDQIKQIILLKWKISRIYYNYFEPMINSRESRRGEQEDFMFYLGEESSEISYDQKHLFYLLKNKITSAICQRD